MRKNDYWVSLQSNGMWVVKKSSVSKAIFLHKTQELAWNEARRLSKNAKSETFLKGRNSRIRMRNTYGKDPFPPKG